MNSRDGIDGADSRTVPPGLHQDLNWALAAALNVVLMANRGTPPGRAEIDAAALELLARHGAQILATARRYAATPEDAEDACQRGLEILLTKAPSTR